MKRGGAGVALLAALLTGAAGAQDLSAYRALAGSLDAAWARSASPEQALAELDRAQAAYTRLAPTLQNRQLLGGLQDALGGARAALARTPAEVQAQVLLARGLMRKALYDQTLGELAQAPANSAAQVRLLASEFGLSGAPARALLADAGAGRPERVAWRLQRAAVAKVGAALGATRPERSPAAYLNLARAASWFTAVQDAGAGTLKVAAFSGALRQLTAGDVPGLTASLTALRRGTAALGRSLATPPALTAKTSTPALAPQPTASRSSKPAPAPARATAAQPTSAPPTPSQSAPVKSVAAAPSLDAAYVALGRALTASGHGDPVTARAELDRAAAALSSAPTGIRGSAGFGAFTRDLNAARERYGLRPGDVQALIAGLGGLEGDVAGEPRSRVDALSAGVARTFSGGLRAITFLLLALLALVPLYLLNLAFGGRNPYWRAITAALALLLLPVFLEGVFGFLGWLGDLSGVAFLRAAPSLTLWQGIYGLPLRALLTALAVGLAAYGFQGLCVQFGLLGRQRPAERAVAQGLDWDEDV
ncbi:hypothetical protein DAERI_160017 [Deinococcus aerius]|uniref:Uncharacterized protein n=1 Tax=Deinococcus aerius TaxID=200253 RepID=A0A2I9CZI0_9DEIO|nr:hypothetical protein [Deinococcus aerius]GBF07639.1 hypothetical protein DAERI_160017 [Deinococcus aerius]